MIKKFLCKHFRISFILILILEAFCKANPFIDGASEVIESNWNLNVKAVGLDLDRFSLIVADNVNYISVILSDSEKKYSLIKSDFATALQSYKRFLKEDNVFKSSVYIKLSRLIASLETLKRRTVLAQQDLKDVLLKSFHQSICSKYIDNLESKKIIGMEYFTNPGVRLQYTQYEHVGNSVKHLFKGSEDPVIRRKAIAEARVVMQSILFTGAGIACIPGLQVVGGVVAIAGPVVSLIDFIRVSIIGTEKHNEELREKYLVIQAALTQYVKHANKLINENRVNLDDIRSIANSYCQSEYYQAILEQNLSNLDELEALIFDLNQRFKDLYLDVDTAKKDIETEFKEYRKIYIVSNALTELRLFRKSDQDDYQLYLASNYWHQKIPTLNSNSDLFYYANLNNCPVLSDYFERIEYKLKAYRKYIESLKTKKNYKDSFYVHTVTKVDSFIARYRAKVKRACRRKAQRLVDTGRKLPVMYNF